MKDLYKAGYTVRLGFKTKTGCIKDIGFGYLVYEAGLYLVVI